MIQNFKPRKILFISESEETYFQITQLLHRVQGFKSEIFWARNYQSGLEQLQNTFDVCLFDDQSLGKYTFAILELIKEESLLLPVVILSDGKSKDRDLRLLRAGAADYLILGKIMPDFLYRSIYYACERRKSQKSLQSIEKDQLRDQKLLSLGALAANVAHGLGTNLEKISDLLNHIEKDLKEDKCCKKINKCQTLLNKSQQFINNLLAFSPAEIKIIPQCNLVDLIIDSTNFLNEASDAKSRVVSMVDSSEPIFVDLNPSEIRQALANLVINATEAQPSGGKIKLALSVPNSWDLPPKLQNNDTRYACITVSDQGLGIAPEHLNSLFDPTFTTKKRANKMGLGLSIVFSIIKAHQGSITVESKLGKGTVFKIFLPLSKENLKHNRKSDCKGLVMVIEPDPSQIEVCKLYFSAAALDSRVFMDSTEALSWYQINFKRVDLIMLADEKPDNCLQDLQEILSIYPQAKVVTVGDSKRLTDASLAQTNGFCKIFPMESKYLSAISWVSEGLGWE